jgi:hypothetical protein
MTLTREQLLASLHTDWGTFVQRLQNLPLEAQAAYLQQQGYARLADLLAHIIAWWQGGLTDVPIMLSDPAYTSPDQDVDQFNAQAVKRFEGVAEADVIARFEDLRRQWLELLDRLPAAAFDDPRLSWRLQIEIIGHYGEHRPG